MFPVSNSAMAKAIRNHDWSQTELGPISEWPSVLRTIVNLVLESDFPKAIVWGPGLVTLHNDAFLKILGKKPPALGRSFADVWSEAWDTIAPFAARAFEGKSTFIEDFPLLIERNGEPEQAYFTFCYSPIRDHDGKVIGMMDTVIETTKTIAAMQTEQVIRHELLHRVKNALTVASAVVNSSLRQAETLEEAREAIGGRFDALSRAHGLIASSGGPAGIDQIVRETISPHVIEWTRVDLRGPHIILEPQQATAISLVAHELATNAVKYGALSTDAGMVEVRWDVSPSGAFEFSWRERCNAAVSPPTRTGFGSRLTAQIAPRYFGGEASLTFEVTGLVYVLKGTMGMEADET